MKVESDSREAAYRFVVMCVGAKFFKLKYSPKVYTAVSFSLAAILAVFITLPLVNQYIASVHLRVQHEMDFCKVHILPKN